MSFILRHWMAKKVTGYANGDRVLEYESDPPGITRFEIRSKGHRQQSFNVGGQLCKTLEAAIALIPHNNKDQAQPNNQNQPSKT